MRESHCELPAYILNKERNVTCVCLCITAEVQSFQIWPGQVAHHTECDKLLPGIFIL